MERNSFLLAGIVGAALLVGCASTSPPQAPLTRAARSTFQPFHTESGEARFVITNMYFTGESAEKTQPHFDAWLKEWLQEFDFCRQGHELLWTRKEPFDSNPSAGGRLLTMGRCR